MTPPHPASSCDVVLLVQAEFDGELDAGQAAALAAHRQECRVCRAAGATLVRARSLMRDGLYQPMPDEMRQRITARLAAARPASSAKSPTPLRSRLRAWWSAGIGFGLGAACAAALALLLVVPSGPDLTGELVASHVRALQPGHLEDVISTDRHTVKPWFDGRLDFAPPVRDPAAVGFPLKGGRLDYVDGRTVAALVYQRDKHIIDLFVWPTAKGASGMPRPAQRHGYNVVHWNSNGMTFWAVSDVELGQLLDFEQAWQHSS